jgi:phosphoribosyl-ATP pyrophosphohydrolase/phosphoribosyl-AMP cyclohydrolase/histidinol dehydrogenase
MSAFRRRSLDELLARSVWHDPEVEAVASAIVTDVQERGEIALREHAGRLDGLRPGDPLIRGPEEMQRALQGLSREARATLERIAGRIRTFADAQRRSLSEIEVALPGGRAGHSIAAVARAGCYAPGGRYPLPSSLLMTVVTARAAGVAEVWVATPRPNDFMLACAAVAGADGVTPAGGAQAIAALAFGAGPIPACDMIAGPGNAWVTAAKRLVFGRVGIDALAGPSELVILADAEAEPELVAADLLAQAEHDPTSIPVLVSASDALIDAVALAIDDQLETLPSATVARAALRTGGAVLVRHLEDAVTACDALAPEHLHLHLRDAAAVARRFSNYGALFIGAHSAEVLGDYGAGPNHVLPTAGASRFSGGLSVMSFLRVRTWLAVTDDQAAASLHEDATWLARHEGLEGHARSAEKRLVARTSCATTPGSVRTSQS